MLVQGSIFLRPEDGDLVRIQGTLAKPPSFWIRHVDIDRRYERIGGVRVPVSLQSVARVLVAGKSTFTVTYQYETVNGQHVGSPCQRPVHRSTVHSRVDSSQLTSTALISSHSRFGNGAALRRQSVYPL